jgi:hypothetical protein
MPNWLPGSVPSFTLAATDFTYPRMLCDCFRWPDGGRHGDRRWESRPVQNGFFQNLADEHHSSIRLCTDKFGGTRSDSRVGWLPNGAPPDRVSARRTRIL